MESRTNRFCQNGGCTAKLGQAALKRVLEKLPRMENENLLVGYSHGDDGAVYRLSEDLAVIHTLDFFSAGGGRSQAFRADCRRQCPQRHIRHGRRCDYSA